MVQAATINDVKRKYLVAYATILSVIFVLLTIIVFIFLTDRGLKAADLENLDELIQNRQFKVNKLEQLNNEFNLEFDKLTAIKTLKDRNSQIAVLKELNGGRIKELDKIFELSEKIIEVSRNDRDFSTIKQYDAISRELYFEYDSLLLFEELTNNYYIQAQTTNSCFNKVNFELSDKKIVLALEKCIIEVEKEISLLKELPYKTPETEKYLNRKKEYWEATGSLYEAIDIQDEDKALILRKSISSLDKEKDLLKTASDKEISSLINIHIQEIGSLENTLEQL